MRRVLMIAFVSIATAGGLFAVSAVPASASTIATQVVLPVVPAAVNVPSAMTATVEPNGTGGTVAITGTVTFSAGGSPISGCQNIPTSSAGGLNASAECDITYTSTGSVTITASYAGDSNWSPSNSAGAVENVLEPATVTASAPATAQLNQTVALSSTVTGSFGTPTGQVMFEDSQGNQLCTATLSGGHGSCNFAFSSGGAQTVKADYLGNSTYANSTGSNSFGTATVVVGVPPTTTSLTAQQVGLSSPSVPPGLTASTMQFTATVAATGSPGAALSGSVSFTINGHPVQGLGCTGQAVSGASPQAVTCSTTDPEQFGGPVVATYSGDPHFAGSTSTPLTPPFTPDTTSINSLTAIPPGVIVGQSLTLRA
ncbi:MAG TPA: Ig-like domain repeat protein, partial [Acidimicrobiales bacterium]|nr:Ig-like domain repeat protein [Acidimicrobiales bacterium]